MSKYLVHYAIVMDQGQTHFSIPIDHDGPICYIHDIRFIRDQIAEQTGVENLNICVLSWTKFEEPLDD